MAAPVAMTPVGDQLPIASLDPPGTVVDGQFFRVLYCRRASKAWDAVLNGGIPSERTYLVQGEPSVGKTTMALLAEEVLESSATRKLFDVVASQESWSDLPVIIFTGAGATVQSRLPTAEPRKRVHGVHPAHGRHRAEGGHTSPPPAAAATSHRVLVVEDNADARKLLVLLLQSFGHGVDTAANGIDAVIRAEHSPPDARFDLHYTKPVEAQKLQRLLARSKDGLLLLRRPDGATRA